jgi:hypothetical protein
MSCLWDCLADAVDRLVAQATGEDVAPRPPTRWGRLSAAQRARSMARSRAWKQRHRERHLARRRTLERGRNGSQA